MIERFAIGMLSIVGLLISAYFAAIYYRVVPTVDRYVPKFCRVEPAACETVLKTPEARLLGVPNFDLGMLYYASLLSSAFMFALWKQLHLMLFLGSIVTVVTGLYLSYVLAFRLRVRCALCFLSHAVNLLIFLILLASL
jgi:uncharacterized membrane protein